MSALEDSFSQFLAPFISGYFSQPELGEGHCPVCTTPIIAPFDVCIGCAKHTASEYRNDLANLVLPLTYGGHTSQSHHLLYTYKSDIVLPPNPDHEGLSLFELTFMVMLAGIQAHRSCIENVCGPINHVAAVPSKKGRSSNALPKIVNAIATHLQIPIVELEYLNTSMTVERKLQPDNWRIAGSPRTIDLGHVLVIDDSWVSGSTAQSVAIALKRAGASSVTVLILARLLEMKWPVTAEYVRRSARPLDLRICILCDPGSATRS